jgi:tetratricopeptide (TPR) repeat protein
MLLPHPAPMERALAIMEKVVGPDHVHTATTLHNLADLRQRLGDLEDARLLYQRALMILEKASDPPLTNRTRHNLATLLLASANADEALAHGAVALAAHDKALGPNHSWTKDSVSITADALDALGRADEAAARREKYRQAR